MKKQLIFICFIGTLLCTGFNCEKKGTGNTTTPTDSSYVNTSHLDHLYTAVTFPSGGAGAGIWIYADAPDYQVVEASGEGYTCVDDVSRGLLVYLRSSKFQTDTTVQAKTFNLIRFILEMQSTNGYFYNFLFSNGLINKFGATSLDNANWWSWRALQALTEAAPMIQAKDPQLYGRMELAINNLINKIKADLVNLPLTTHITSGITVPEWLPAGSGTDQASVLIIALISYSVTNPDAAITAYIKKLADGIALMQQGDGTQFPWGCTLSWENTWHAYGSDQAYALLKTGVFLQDSSYTNKGLTEIKNFYPWLLQNGYKSSFNVQKSGTMYQPLNTTAYEQIAYGIRPMVFAAVEAYKLTNEQTYADIAGHLAAWLLGANETNSNMYDKSNGRTFDAISSAGNINHNSGAESTIEALLTLQRVEANPAVDAAMKFYKK